MMPKSTFTEPHSTDCICPECGYGLCAPLRNDPEPTWAEKVQSGDDLVMKERINLLLFQILPAAATLRETEAMAVSIYTAVQRCYEHHEKAGAR